MVKIIVLITLMAGAQAVSPVMKVVELLDECKAKVSKDLAAEAAAMEEFSTFCDDTLKDKAYAIETAGREIEDLGATIADAQATAAEAADEIATLGSVIAAKNGEMYEATTVSKQRHTDFLAAEKELLTTVDQLSRAGILIKKEMSFAQGKMNVARLAKQLKPMTTALSQIIEAEWVTSGSRKTLKSFFQQAAAAKESEDDDLTLEQPQAKTVAFESSSGGILTAIEEMQGKAEDTLSSLRKKEMQGQYSFEMVKTTLNGVLKNNEDKLSTAKSTQAGATEAGAKATGELTATTKAKAADEEYASTLKTDCEMKAGEWAQRQKDATEEMAVIAKAKDILVGGVKAFVQMKSVSKNSWSPDSDDEDDKTAERREKVVGLLKELATTQKSYALTQMAAMAQSDPFVKIRGLIEDMIAKLLKEAQEEATQKAFCDEEIGKSKKSQEEKQTKIDDYQTRIDGASSTIATLTEDVKTLEAEIAEIDKTQAEATAARAKENADYVQASTDFRDSAQAVAKAIEVLKNYYEGSLIQVSTKTGAKQPAFGAAKSDTASTIVSVLEMSEEDFTKLLAESEAEEDAAATAYAKLTDENKIAKATKQSASKGKQSEMKSLSVELEHSKEDHASVSAELDAVLTYLDKLKPQCEEKAMSYAEKKAKREAEIDGLKEALSILEGGIALVQSQKHLRVARRI